MAIKFTNDLRLFQPLSDKDPAAIGQGDRTMLIPIVHQILANPEGNHHFPEWLGMSDLKVLCPVWEAAYYVCRRLIGWTDVGKGLQWFYQNELQTLSDPRLKLLKSIWNRGNHLSMFAMWAWTQPINRDPNTFRGEEFYRQFIQEFPSDIAQGPYWGGTNPLHIGHCLGGGWLSTHLPSDELDVRENLLSNKESRRATLILDHFRPWPEALQSAGRLLPNLGNQSWYVDVIVKPIGWLGTFRQSRVTKIWFQGKHRIHEPMPLT